MNSILKDELHRKIENIVLTFKELSVINQRRTCDLYNIVMLLMLN